MYDTPYCSYNKHTLLYVIKPLKYHCKILGNEFYGGSIRIDPMRSVYQHMDIDDILDSHILKGYTIVLNKQLIDTSPNFFILWKTPPVVTYVMTQTSYIKSYYKSSNI